MRENLRQAVQIPLRKTAEASLGKYIRDLPACEVCKSLLRDGKCPNPCCKNYKK